MNIDRWISGYKVRSFPWIDGRYIYINVQYFAPGQSINQPPVWEKSIYLTDNPAGQKLIHEYLDSLVNHIAQMHISKNSKVIIEA